MSPRLCGVGLHVIVGSGIGGVDDYIPTAPRASLGGSLIDIEDLPRNPPFQAFVGNLPFEVRLPLRCHLRIRLDLTAMPASSPPTHLSPQATQPHPHQI